MNKQLLSILFICLLQVSCLKYSIYADICSLQDFSFKKLSNELLTVKIDEKIPDYIKDENGEREVPLSLKAQLYTYLPILDVKTSVKTLYGHTGSVNSVIQLNIGVFAGCLASASYDRTVRIWNSFTGKCLRILKHSSAVRSVMQLQHGDYAGYLASVSWEHIVTIWNPLSGKCVCILKGHTGFIHSVIQLSHGDLAECLISASWDNSVRVWNPYSGECIRALSYDEDRELDFWPSVTGERIRTLKQLRPVNAAIKLKYGEYAGHFLFVPNDCILRILDPITGNYVRSLEKYMCAGSGKVQLRNGNIAAGFVDCSIKVRDISGGRDECIRSLSGHSDFITSLIQLEDGRLVSTSWGHVIKIWDMYPQDVCDLSLEQYILVAQLQFHKRNGDNIQLHADWYEVFNTLPEYFQNQYLEYLDNHSFNFAHRRWCAIL
jgi:WD40 repeat protein